MATQPVEISNPIETAHPMVVRGPRRSYPWAVKVRNFVSKLIFNAIPFVITLGFMWLQIQIGAQGGWLSKVEIAMSVLVEIVLVFIWSLFV